MVNHISVDGVSRAVTNTLSSGPGCETHTYELTRGAYVYRVGRQWLLSERGRESRPVAVEVA